MLAELNNTPLCCIDYSNSTIYSYTYSYYFLAGPFSISFLPAGRRFLFLNPPSVVDSPQSESVHREESFLPCFSFLVSRRSKALKFVKMMGRQ